MEVEDFSLWHHLIFCEELANVKYQTEIICWVCAAPVSGCLAFKCLECDFVQHKSCTQQPNLIEMDIKHEISKRHHLILSEETENKGTEEVICSGCGKFGIGPTYRCSFPQCTFHLHKSCNQLPHAIQHIVHPNHILLLQLPSSRVSCDLCGKHRKKDPLLYGCRLCNFDVDIKCLSRCRIIDDCYPHAFIISRKPNKFKVKKARISSACVGIVASGHRWCTQFPPTIRIIFHHHLLIRTYCLRGVKKLEKAICKLCCKKLNVDCGAYYCQVCDYIVHMMCAIFNMNESTINSKATEFDDYTEHLVYLVEGLDVEEEKTAAAHLKIKHYSHPQHELVLNHEDLRNDKRCEACMQFIVFPPFYNCADCNIFVHKRCAKLPETIRRLPFNQNLQTLTSLSSTTKLFGCCMCKCYRHGLFYTSEGKNYDVQCFLIPETISHESHEHLLHVPTISDRGFEENCIGCGWTIIETEPRLMCSDCKFCLCFKCAILPLVARYRYHAHLLKLTYKNAGDLEECYCLICEEKRDPMDWFYSCGDCDFAVHIQCVIGSPLKSGSHEHPVILVEEPENSPECHSCKKSIRDYFSLECTQCKFCFHFTCYYS